MSLFSAIDISATGIDAMQSWINTNAGNIANADDVTSTNGSSYAPEIPVFSAINDSNDSAEGQGVSVQVELGNAKGLVEPAPGNPLADANGQVQVPDISLSDQLVGLMEAQDGYQGDAEAISRAVAAYQAGLTIGS